MSAEAIEQFQKLGYQPHALGHMGNAFARMGRAAEAREMIRKLEEHVQKTGGCRIPNASKMTICHVSVNDKSTFHSKTTENKPKLP